MESMEIALEPMTDEHSKAVMAIFNYYIENSYAAYFEQSLPEAFYSKLLQKINGYPAYVLKDTLRDQTMGFGFLSSVSSFAGVSRNGRGHLFFG
jgi:L-amino acid N-acyltransferase YncA